jgi:hypothetical protein
MPASWSGPRVALELELDPERETDAVPHDENHVLIVSTTVRDFEAVEHRDPARESTSVVAALLAHGPAESGQVRNRI